MKTGTQTLLGFILLYSIRTSYVTPDYSLDHLLKFTKQHSILVCISTAIQEKYLLVSLTASKRWDLEQTPPAFI